MTLTNDIGGISSNGLWKMMRTMNDIENGQNNWGTIENDQYHTV